MNIILVVDLYSTRYGDGEEHGKGGVGDGYGYGDSGYFDGSGSGQGEGAMKFQRGCGQPFRYGDKFGNGRSLTPRKQGASE